MPALKDKRKFKRLFLFAALLFLSGVTVILLLPRIINTETVKGRLISLLSQKVPGTVYFQSADISLFPVPRVLIQNAGLTVPKKLQATMKTIAVYPKLFQLLCGEVRLSRIEVLEPDVNIALPAESSDQRRSFEDTAALTRALARGSAKTVIRIENGMFNFIRDGRAPVQVTGIELQSALTEGNDKVTFTLDRLISKKPALSVSGSATVDMLKREVRIIAESKNLQVMPVREVVLALAGDIPAAAKIFDILRGGNITQITFRSRADSPYELIRTPNMSIRGSLKDGVVFIPRVGLEFSEVAGECEITEGILKGNNITGRTGNSRFRSGVLTIGLQGDDPPFNLEAAVVADLNDVKDILNKTVRQRSFLHELALIRSVKGTAEGKIVLGESLKKITPYIVSDKMNFGAAYERVPYVIEVKQGLFSYDKKTAEFKGLYGSIGRSSFSELHGRLSHGLKPHLAIHSGKAEMDTGEIYRWLSTYEQLKAQLKRIESVDGRVVFSSMRFQGLVLDSRKWDYSISGSVEKLSINTPLLPGTMNAKTGKFEAGPGKFVFSDLDAKLLDSSSIISGRLYGSLDNVRKGGVRFSGTVGPAALKWITKTFRIPEYVRTDRPITVSDADFTLQGREFTGFGGTIRTGSGQTVVIDLSRTPDSLLISRLDVEDRASKASVALDISEKIKSIGFKGSLDSTTIANLVTLPQVQGGMLQGEMKGVFSADAAVPFRATGRLRGEKIVLPWKKDLPVAIDSMVVSSDNELLHIESAMVRLADNAFSLNGIVASRAEGLVMDMNVSSEHMVWKQFARAIEEGEETVDAKKEGRLYLRFLGSVRLKADTFLYDNLTIHGLQSDIELSPGRVMAAVKKASYCNMAITGAVTRKKQDLNIDLHTVARDIELRPTIACVTDRNAEMNGRFDIDAQIGLTGKTAVDPRSLHGTLAFRAKDGRIHRFTALAKIFSLLNVTEIFRGRLPDLIGEGFAYRSFIVGGDISHGKLILKDASIDSPSMGIVGEGNIDLVNREMDMTILVAPFRTIDAVLNVLPGWKGGIVSIPFSVTGSLKDPHVAYKPSAVVRTGLTGFMENLLKAPVKLFEPLMSEETK